MTLQLKFHLTGVSKITEARVDAEFEFLFDSGTPLISKCTPFANNSKNWPLRRTFRKTGLLDAECGKLGYRSTHLRSAISRRSKVTIGPVQVARAPNNLHFEYPRVCLGMFDWQARHVASISINRSSSLEVFDGKFDIQSAL